MEDRLYELALSAAEVLRNIKTEFHDDPETAHIEADDFLCDLLEDLGFDDVVSEYYGIIKWYA